MLNNGQSCIAAKRFIVAESISDRFTEKLIAKFGELKVGDPMADDTDIGPLATKQILTDLETQVENAVKKGAKVLIGGKAYSDRPGNYYPPTILTNIDLTSRTSKEEFFGPVAMLFTVKDLDQAIALANDIPFGLGASGWTNDSEEQQRLINAIEAGAVFINSLVKSDPRLPFGGIKRSGYGRELGVEGIREFVNQKNRLG